MLPMKIATRLPITIPSAMKRPTKIPTCSFWSSLTHEGAIIAHYVETNPFEIENTIKLVTLKTSLPKTESGAQSRAKPMVVMIKTVLKIDKNITNLGENTLRPPEYLPTVSKTLNYRITIS